MCDQPFEVNTERELEEIVIVVVIFVSMQVDVEGVVSSEPDAGDSIRSNGAGCG